MFLSYIIPVYNVEQYLEECIISLVNQDIPIDEYEIICINDGSTDNSLAILQKLKDQYGNIKIINKKNEGVSSARNVGLNTAIGDYIWFVDSDDFILSNILGEIKRHIESDAVDMLQLGTYSFVETMSESQCQMLKDRNCYPILHGNSVFVCRNIYRRAFLQRINVSFCMDLKFSEDILFNSEVFANNPKVSRIEKAFYFYRQRKGSLVKVKSSYQFNEKMDMFTHLINSSRHFYDIAPERYKCETANNYMINVCSSLYDICCMNCSDFRSARKIAESNGYFLKNCAKECSWYNNPGRFEFDLYIRIYCKPFFYLMRFICFVKSIFKRIIRYESY